MEPLDIRASEPDAATSATQPPSPSTPVQSPKEAMESPPPLAIKRRPPPPHSSELTFSQTLSDETSTHKLQTLEEQFKALMRDSSVTEEKSPSSSCQNLTSRTLFAFREDQASVSDNDCDEYQSIEAEESESEVALEDVMGEFEFGVGPARDRKRAVENDSVDRKQKRIKDERKFIQKSIAENQEEASSMKFRELVTKLKTFR